MIPLYVMDSILKNVGGVFTRIVMQNLAAVFSGAFAHVDNAIRASMIKLLDTWQTQAVFPPHLIDDIRGRLAVVLQAPSLPAPDHASTVQPLHGGWGGDGGE